MLTHSQIAQDRAERLFEGLGAQITRCERGRAGAQTAVATVRRVRPSLTYLIDVGVSTTAGALTAAASRSRVVVDTGDLNYELVKSAGIRGPMGEALVWAGEKAVLGVADHVVVRGTAHVGMLKKPATFIPDLAPPNAHPTDGRRVREQLGLGRDAFVVGLVGTLVWLPRLQIAYGWDLIEALAHTGPEVVAVILGRGDASPWLERRAADLGVSDRCVFAGFIDPTELPDWIGAMDVAISTQTNDAVGAVRTTTKLPLYLGCGCPVLASDVGEARRVLGPLGWTIRYDAVVDRAYPERLAAKIEEWRQTPGDAAARRQAAIELSAREYDPIAARSRLRSVLDTVARGA